MDFVEFPISYKILFFEFVLIWYNWTFYILHYYPLILLFSSNPRILLSVLHFLKALWEGAVQYINVLEHLKSTRTFWKQLCNCISVVTSLKTSVLENLTKVEAQSLVYKYCCQSAVLEIMAYEMFLKKKMLHAESLLKEAPHSKGNTENVGGTEKLQSASDFELEDILSSWCDSSILGNLMKSYTYCEYDDQIFYRAKVSFSLSFRPFFLWVGWVFVLVSLSRIMLTYILSLFSLDSLMSTWCLNSL